MRKGIWKKGKRTIRGWWVYNWAADNFSVEIDQKDKLTGSQIRRFKVYADTPEWNGWKLLRTYE